MSKITKEREVELVNLANKLINKLDHNERAYVAAWFGYLIVTAITKSSKNKILIDVCNIVSREISARWVRLCEPEESTVITTYRDGVTEIGDLNTGEKDTIFPEDNQ